MDMVYADSVLYNKKKYLFKRSASSLLFGFPLVELRPATMLMNPVQQHSIRYLLSPSCRVLLLLPIHFFLLISGLHKKSYHVPTSDGATYFRLDCVS